MARFASPAAVATAGVYRAVVEFYEADFAAWEANSGRCHGAGAPYPRRRILAALRAGGPVNVPLWSLPSWARTGAPPRMGRSGLATITVCRAIVDPADAIVWSDDNSVVLWLEENGE